MFGKKTIEEKKKHKHNTTQQALKRSLVMESPLTVTSIASSNPPPSVSIFEWKQIFLVGVLFVVVTIVILALKLTESAEL